MGIYEVEFRDIISPKCVELQLAGNDRYRPKFLAPTSALHVVSDRVLSSKQEGQEPVIFARYLVVEIPSWKARSEKLTEDDEFPNNSADASVDFLLSGGRNPLGRVGDVSMKARAINAPLSEYIDKFLTQRVAN